MEPSSRVLRPPVVVVLGHVDHGKSSLLDHIRSTNVVAGEAGGITQHTAAYEVEHEIEGEKKTITFIDTPGHEAFGAQRTRGASLADIAVLVVSAEDGVKAQTKEALLAIETAKIPYVVAINKIDLPGADIERAKNSLVENGVYLEGHGGAIPYVGTSAKTGEGIPNLLELILLSAELLELSMDPTKNAEGVIVEAHRDPKKGISATLILTEGTLSTGMFLAGQGAMTPVRTIHDPLGKTLGSATPSSPVVIIGWSDLPMIGTNVKSFEKKKDAESYANEHVKERPIPHTGGSVDGEVVEEDRATIPLILKADVAGSLDALAHEVHKLSDERVSFKILHADVGAIGESDIKRAGGDARTVIVGFNTHMENGVREQAERAGILIMTDEIIYKLSEKLVEIKAARRPKRREEEISGTTRVLKIFSATRMKQVVGLKVEEGVLSDNDTVRVMRRGEEIGKGKIMELQRNKERTSRVEAGVDCGAKIDATVELATGDTIVAFTFVER
ncbi:MAG: translation initiation factor IF-2 [Patescibacteria group bacterium]|mgnify:CR=1 FL=1